MKERLKRDLNKTYLIFSSEALDYEESYETKMIMRNEPKTILPLHILRVDGSVELFYDVSAKQTLKDCMNSAKLTSDTIRKLFMAIKDLEEDVREYLLDMENVVLDLEHIYTKEGVFYFCYCPWERKDLLNSFREMLEEILGNLDYRDTKGVEIAYHLYQSACKGDFDIGKILEEHSLEEQEVTAESTLCSDSFEIEEVMETQSFESFSEEEKSVEEKKPGIFKRILRFFLKKEEVKEETSLEEFPEIEPYEELSYTEIFVPSSSDTVLLGELSAGRWKLRPLSTDLEEFCITKDCFLVGKSQRTVDGFIGRETISRVHSRLFVRNDKLYISDANSTNGTFVNGIAIDPGKEVEIFVGDRIMFADVGYECYNSL